MKTIEQVRKEFEYSGQSMTRWAQENGYPVHLVQQVLSGRSRFLRGKSHEIAVLLRLKDGYIKESSGGGI
ncbi:MAG: DNA-binding protein [Undibacterium sp.]|uniref:DNA-binding protein n=1 Tax=Undibacterium sp. TaxID=1914977 RepID=UPI002715BC1A|nr:DNA-binding protein [Undibacterium sp.]MDO8653476.1 DNA-binding protein [Undibacterium sp.]